VFAVPGLVGELPLKFPPTPLVVGVPVIDELNP
jgi:hypothetical protein